MVDKNYCMSSFLTFRYIEDSNKEFYEGLHHTGDMPYPDEKKVRVHTAADIAKAYKEMNITVTVDYVYNQKALINDTAENLMNIFKSL